MPTSGVYRLRQTKHKKLTPRKAKMILEEGMARGHKLTKKQKRFFGAMTSGMPMKKMMK